MKCYHLWLSPSSYKPCSTASSRLARSPLSFGHGPNRCEIAAVAFLGGGWFSLLAFGICKWPSTMMSTYMCADMSVLLAVVSGLPAGTMCSRIFTVVVYGLRTTLLFLNALEYRISLLPPNPSVCVCVCVGIAVAVLRYAVPTAPLLLCGSSLDLLRMLLTRATKI